MTSRVHCVVALKFGQVLHNYRKTHLYCTYVARTRPSRATDVARYERLYFTAGDKLPPPFEYRGWKIGLLICFDTEYPEPARALTLMGANFIIAIAANGATFTTRVTIPQRAQENNVYLAYANRVGKENAHTFNGGADTRAPWA